MKNAVVLISLCVTGVGFCEAVSEKYESKNTVISKTDTTVPSEDKGIAEDPTKPENEAESVDQNANKTIAEGQTSTDVEEKGTRMEKVEDRTVNQKGGSDSEAVALSATLAKEALRIVNGNINAILSGHPAKINEVFRTLRDAFLQTEFSDEELLDLIDDAAEIRRKYHLMMECVARIEYARKAVEFGISPKQALQLASSEYIQLPNHVLKGDYNSSEFNQMVSDVGCGVIWKDRLKYFFVLNRYFRNDEKLQAENSGSISERMQRYAALLEENDEFHGKSFEHLRYVIAQNFYYGGVSEEKILKIFELSKEEWKRLVTPVDYRLL